MTKYLLLIALAAVVWWLWRKSLRSRVSRLAVRSTDEVENMVKCAHCGVNQPVSDSILADERYYCCAAHRRAAESTQP